MNKKVKILEYLIANFNDGRRKGFYCLAVNLICFPDLEKSMKRIVTEIDKSGMDKIKKIKCIIELFESIAEKKKIELKLRKQ